MKSLNRRRVLRKTGAAIRSSLEVNLTLLTPVAGAITALPVVAVFCFGLYLGSVRTAIAMAVGANLLAIISLIGAPRLSLRLALADTLLMGLSVFVGSATAHDQWLHAALLVPWCFGAGMLVSFGQTQAAVGSQAVIAYLLLGRSSTTVLVALHLSSLVVAGSLVEILAVVVLRLPPSLRSQRHQLANTLDAVAELARRNPRHSAIDLLAILDRTEHVLAKPSLLGRSDVRHLRAALDLIRRMRLELTTLSGLRTRLLSAHVTHAVEEVDDFLEEAAATLVAFAASLRRPREPLHWQAHIAKLRATLALLQRLDTAPSTASNVLIRQSFTYLVAVGGQIRATGHLIEKIRSSEQRITGAFAVPTFHRADSAERLLDFSILRTDLHYDSTAFRHAVRLSIAVPVSAAVASWLSLPRSYWVPFAVVVILKPDYNTLIRRGVGRMIGTLLGATLAALLISELHPDLDVTAVLVALTAWGAYTTWAASFPVAIGFVTALVLILLSTSLSDTVATAAHRFIDVGLGGVIAAVSYLVWPSSQRHDVNRAHAELFSALAIYFELVTRMVRAQPIDDAEVIAASRAARVAWAAAETAVARSDGEPTARELSWPRVWAFSQLR